MAIQKFKKISPTKLLATALGMAFAGTLFLASPSHAILVDDTAPKFWCFDVGALLATDPWYGAQATLTLDVSNPFGPNEDFWFSWLDEISDTFSPTTFISTGIANTSIDTQVFAPFDPASGATDSDIYLALIMGAGDSMEVNSVSLTALYGQTNEANLNLLSQEIEGVAVIPEPSTFLLLGGGLVGLAFAARWKKKA